jgi:hypothetical protein
MLAHSPARAIVSSPAVVSLPWIAVDLFTKTGWGLVAPFAFITAIGATLAFGGPWFLAMRADKYLSSSFAHFLVGAGLGVLAIMAGAFAFDPDLPEDAMKTPPDGGWGQYPLFVSHCGGVLALVSRLVGAQWKSE